MKNLLNNTAIKLGFVKIGVTTAEPVDVVKYLKLAADEGRISEMKWLARDVEKRCDPSSLLTGAKSVVCFAYPYRFARGRDYHEVVMQKLKTIESEIKKINLSARTKLCVDTSPILEKALAERAGLGWIGKHTVLVNEKFGSFLVLGEIITDLEIEPDTPSKNLCGECRKCIDACPTGAIASPRKLDSRSCISYWTTMAKSPPPSEIAKFIHEETFGCDLCQNACPCNHV